MARVGPVLRNEAMTNAIVEAIREDTHGPVDVTDRRAYIRVEAEDHCVVTKETLDERLGEGAVEMPGGIEQLLSSFKGYIKPRDDRVEFVSDMQDTKTGSESEQ